MGHFDAEHDLSFEEYLSPFARPTSRHARPIPALAWDDGPFVPAEAAEHELAADARPSDYVLEVWEPKQKYGRTLYEKRTLTAADRDEPDAIEVEAWRFPGRTPSVALVFGGVHGTESIGVEVVNQLKQQLIKAAERGRRPEYTTVVIPELITAGRRWKGDPKSDDPRRKANPRYVNVDGDPVEPNRNFPSPGESYAVALQRGLSRSDKAELLGPNNQPLRGDKVTHRMLAETRILIRLIEEENVVRAVSVHAHRVPGERGDGPGIFVDPRPWPPKAWADIRLAAAMIEDAMKSLGATADAKLDLRDTAGKRLDHPFHGNFADEKTNKIPEAPMPTVRYTSTEHPVGTSFGGWAPARGIVTITSELPRWQDVSSIVRNKLINVHENAILRVFLGGLKAPGQTESNGESLAAESQPSTPGHVASAQAVIPAVEAWEFEEIETEGGFEEAAADTELEEPAGGAADTEDLEGQDSRQDVEAEEIGRELASPASTFESIVGEVLEGVLGQVSELGRRSEEMERVGRRFENAPATEADIADLFKLGRGIGHLGQGIGAALSVGPPSSAADVSAAVPEFNFLTRLSMPAPLLNAAANAKAVQWNGRHHPATSGVDPRNIRTDVARYVNLTAIATAIQNFNAANPTKAIQLGTPPVDAVLVEGIHQFQAKCFFETSQIDGMAGESTLDSLGLVKRTGMNSVDQRNAGAHARLGRVDVAGLTSNEFKADTWFDHMVNPSFLGWRFLTGGAPRGAHLSFVRKLRIAERALLEQSKFSGKTPVELGKALGFDATSEEHKGARPTVTGASMHTYGLAVDIKYTGNPWVQGADFLAALKRSALLMSGVRITQPTSQRFLHDLGADATRTTAAIFDILAQRSRDFRDYLALSANGAGLTAVLQRRRAEGTAGIFAAATESIADAVQRWRTDIQNDLRSMRAQASPFRSGTTRDPLLGFLNLDRDLVIALRDTACLAWGAVDIGSGADGSGDMMHFDDRVCGIGQALAGVGGNFQPRSGHPCVACGVPVASEDTETFADLEDPAASYLETAGGCDVED
jgi:hypothetical protein